jgi:predicted metal-binding membrane protein
MHNGIALTKLLRQDRAIVIAGAGAIALLGWAYLLYNLSYLERAIGLLQQKGRTISDLAGESPGCERSFPPTLATTGG